MKFHAQLSMKKRFITLVPGCKPWRNIFLWWSPKATNAKFRAGKEGDILTLSHWDMWSLNHVGILKDPCIWMSFNIIERDNIHQYLSLLTTGSTKEALSRHNWKIVDWNRKNQIKQTKFTNISVKTPEHMLMVSYCFDYQMSLIGHQSTYCLKNTPKLLVNFTKLYNNLKVLFFYLHNLQCNHH